MKDRPAIVEIKTGAVLPSYSIQMAGYANLLPEPSSYERVMVTLFSTGHYRTDVYSRLEFRADLATFLSCLNIVQFKTLHRIGE